MSEALIVTPSIAVAGSGDPASSPSPTNIYGVRIDMSSSDPTGACVYSGDAANFEPLSCNQTSGAVSYGDWATVIDQIIGCKPCLYKSGARSVYLNPNNFAQNASGTAVDITSGSAGDVMIEFKKCYYRWRISGNFLYFEITGQDMSADSSWSCEAFKRSGGSVQNYMYYGAYEGTNVSSKLRSLSGKTPTANITIGTARTYATANGSNYQQEEIAKRMYIIGLIMLVTKSRNAQATIGAGWTGGSAAATTGTCNTKGMFYGTSSGTVVAKVFGIENFWGSLWKWCDGFVSGASGVLNYKTYGPYNDAGTNYSSVSGIPTGSGYPTIMTVIGSNGVIVPISTSGGSNSSYFPDYWHLNAAAGRVCLVGGYWNYGADAGPLGYYVSRDASNTSTDVGARLSAC